MMSSACLDEIFAPFGISLSVTPSEPVLSPLVTAVTVSDTATPPPGTKLSPHTGRAKHNIAVAVTAHTVFLPLPSSYPMDSLDSLPSIT